MKKMYYSRIFVLLLIICSCIFAYYIINHDFLSILYKGIILTTILVLVLFILKLSSAQNRFFRTFAGFIALMLALAQGMGMIFVTQLDSFLVKLSSQDKTVINVYVKANSKLEVKDLENKEVGMLQIGEIGFYHSANKSLNAQLVPSTSFSKMVKDLELNQFSAIMVDAKELSKFKQEVPDYENRLKLLISIEVDDLYYQLRSESVTEDVYHIYVSGIDQFGEIPDYGLSDVNMVLTVNPKKEKILISTIPRDSLVYNQCVSSKLSDKLTHIGNNGVSCSMQTISNLLGIKINYYIKLNFSSIQDIVDSLGGITVHSDQSFNTFDMTEEEYHFRFHKGENELNGVQALVFARQRNSFEDGDIQRGRNQQEVFKGILNKIKSPSIIVNYDKLLLAISKNVKTSFTSNEIKALLKNQLEKNPNWQIESQTLTGENVAVLTQSYPDEYLSAFEIHKESLQKMIQKIKEVAKE